MRKNLALLYRPKSLDDFLGQEHLLAPGAPLRKLIEREALQHSFFYGPPGTGKTTLARLVAEILDRPFYELNATTLKVDELRSIFKRYAQALRKPLVFIDEVHRLSRTQQEVLLPFMERYDALIVGASTENPYFSLTAAMRSRSLLFEFKPLQPHHLERMLEKVAQKEGIIVDEAAAAYLIDSSGGDMRAMLNLLEAAAATAEEVSVETLRQLRPAALHDGANSGDTHYNLASAFIKSMRGSDIDAALYWMARLIVGGEPPEFIARRMVIFASEDIGNANPNALGIAVDTMTAVSRIGYPEARIILSQCCVYLTSSPKSNAAYTAVNRAVKAVEKGELQPVPRHLRSPDHPGYLYPHDFGGWVEQPYLQKPLKFYESKRVGYEKRLDEWIEKIRTGSSKPPSR
ncbi:replication-associated recombination protein A [Hydrogenimonas sp.]|uniref:replication-associated recombination protein A n=1 Tax=Hydrogenimonas sp. TaxID=2231112 RepID=UPI002635676D|nr:replication-associated recombination protein A [Hydrogenimonas sp.]